MTQCLSWPLDERRAEVRCFTSGGTPIALCGHGLLCSAAWWSQRWPGDGVLTMGNTVTPCQTRGDFTWLGFPRPTLHPIPPPDWLSALYADCAFVDAATAGEDDGYLLAELAPDTELQSLPLPGEGLAQQTDRALLLCTRVKQRARADETVHFRYFAPQYDTPEDAATGSAMRLLGSWLDPEGARGEITAFQASAGGGLLKSHVDGELTWVGGRVDLEGRLEDGQE